MAVFFLSAVMLDFPPGFWVVSQGVELVFLLSRNSGKNGPKQRKKTSYFARIAPKPVQQIRQ
jgi:hypothetical protein